jgi:uncharacterized protein
MIAQSPTAPIEARSASPIPPGERLLEVDILRGFALFGILLVNMGLFGHSFYEYVLVQPASDGRPDAIAAFLIAFLAEGKFYSLFSFLFGFGLAIQMSRALTRGTPFVPFYLRRMAILLGIGLVHAYLIWVGDILVAYAVLGVLLLLFRNRRPRTLVIWSVALLVFISLVYLALMGLMMLASLVPDGTAAVQEVNQAMLAEYEAAAAQANRVYTTGSFFDLIGQRVVDLNFIYTKTLYTAPNIFAMFLLGLAAGKKGIFNDITANRSFFRKLQIWGLVVGVPGNLVFALAGRSSFMSDNMTPAFLASIGQTLGAPMLSAFYLATIVLLAQNPRWRARLSVLAPVGRMSLSNYLFQSLVCTTIFYSYGLGLFGQVGPAAGVLLTVVIYLVQIPMSHWWMKRFQFGPVEWLWRTLTYGKAQRMKAAQA